jgi:hypothetical protein
LLLTLLSTRKQPSMIQLLMTQENFSVFTLLLVRRDLLLQTL